MVRRAGRVLAKSSSFTTQLLSDSVPMDAAREFVILENCATPFVTDCNNNRIASVVFVVAGGFGATTVTAPAVITVTSRFNESEAPATSILSTRNASCLV